MKIALAQLNYLIGDFEGNLAKMLQWARKATEQGADLILFSELAICGYPPLDLLERKTFVEACMKSIQRLAREVNPQLGVLVGGPEFNPEPAGKALFNSAFFILEGRIQQVFRKALLPTYDIFDEYRYFESNKTFQILEFKGKRLAVTICEDLWDEQPFENEFARSRLYTLSPMDELLKQDPDIILNLSASPFAHRKTRVKEDIFTQKARQHQLPLLICNQCGAQTELIFDGASLAINSRGQVVHRLESFNEGFALIDAASLDDLPEEREVGEDDRIPLIHDALVCGIRDYFIKMGFSKATLGLSGGIDSALTLALASRALGPEALHVLLLPSQYSSTHSVEDSVELANNLGVSYHTLAIKALFDEFRSTLKPVFGDLPEDITEENLQARIRGTLLMALSNKFGNILLNTSNKSETAVGYGTLYGDMSGGLSVLGDVYKEDVYALARFINRQGEVIPQHIITKAPSAELRPDQKDSDSLPPYEVLDQVLEAYIERQQAPASMNIPGADEATIKRIIRLVDQNEYKRYQTPPILRISSKAFGVGRRLPLVGRYG